MRASRAADIRSLPRPTGYCAENRRRKFARRSRLMCIKYHIPIVYNESKHREWYRKAWMAEFGRIDGLSYHSWLLLLDARRACVEKRAGSYKSLWYNFVWRDFWHVGYSREHTVYIGRCRLCIFFFFFWLFLFFFLPCFHLVWPLGRPPMFGFGRVCCYWIREKQRQ